MKLLRILMLIGMVAVALLFATYCISPMRNDEGGPVPALSANTWASLLPLLVPFLIVFFLADWVTEKTTLKAFRYRRLMLIGMVAVALLFATSCISPMRNDGGGPVPALSANTWASLLPLLVPFLIMFFQQAGLPKRINGFIALGLCVIAVVADGYFFHGLGSIKDWYGEMGLVVSIIKDMAVEVFVIYELMQKIGLADWVTEKTTLKAFRYRRIV